MYLRHVCLNLKSIVSIRSQVKIFSIFIYLIIISSIDY
jgi:hypothetical protein